MDIERSNVNQNSRNKDAKTKMPHRHNNSKILSENRRTESKCIP